MAGANLADDTGEQIAQLRRQVEDLMNNQVTPALANAAQRAGAAADAVSGRVQEQPMLTLLLAAGIGYLLGRAFR